MHCSLHARAYLGGACRHKCQTPLHGHRLPTCCTTLYRRTSSQQVLDVVQHVRDRLNLLYNILLSSCKWPKLHYTDIGYGHVVQHHQRTSSQQFYNLLYDKFVTPQCQRPRSRHVKMLGCGKFLSVGGEFVVQQQVVELL